MSYRKGNIPSEPAQMPSTVDRELSSIQREWDAARDFVFLNPLHAQPGRLFDGLVVLADGTDWNPGSGAGYYGYQSGAWSFMGGASGGGGADILEVQVFS